MADIRINQLPPGGGPVATDFLPLDNGTTRRATVKDVVEIGRPAASQVEAETAVNATKVMTPLTTSQAVSFYGLTKADNLSGLSNVAAARGNLGLGNSSVLNVGTTAGTVAAGDDSRIVGALQPSAIGVSIQAYDSGLTSIAGLTTAADRMIYTTAPDVYATTALTPFARTILDDANAAAARSTLGLGTNAVNALGISYPEDFGAVGDGVANDTAALQAWATHLCTYGGIAAAPGRKVYLHNAPIIWTPQVNDGSGGTYTPASGIIFEPRHKPIHFMLHASEFRATAAMAYQWRFIYGDGITVTAQAPFFVRFENGFFNRNGLASESIRTEFAGWWKILGTRFDGGSGPSDHFTGTCIKQIGYGAAEVRNCQARGQHFLDISDATTYPGTDSSYTFNDLYLTGVGFLIGPGTGSLGIYENTLTVETAANTTANLVKIDATAAAAGILNRDLTIECNRQAGGGAMVYLRGKTGTKNIRNSIVRGNTYTHYGASTAGAIIDAQEVSGIKVRDNMFSDRDMSNTTSLKAVTLTTATLCEVSGNVISKVNETAIALSGVTRTEVHHNVFQNVGSATFPNVIALLSSSSQNDIHDNTAIQDSSSFATTLVAEDGTSNFNRAWNNRSSNMVVNHLPQGASSDMGNPMRHDTYQATGGPIPTNSTYYLGAGKVSASETDTYTVVSRPCLVTEFFVRVTGAPGASQSFTYTLRKTGVDTALTGTISGAASFSVTASTAAGISYAKGDIISLKVVTSNGSAAVAHSSYVLVESQ